MMISYLVYQRNEGGSLARSDPVSTSRKQHLFWRGGWGGGGGGGLVRADLRLFEAAEKEREG